MPMRSKVDALLAWRPDAAPEQRAAHATALGRALQHELPHDLRGAIEGTLLMVAADPVPRVRLALAEAVSTLRDAPLPVIAQLATDRPDIAGLVLARSPVVTQSDLIDLVPRLDPRVVPVLAARATEPSVAALIIELGEADAAAELLRNPALPLGASMLEAIADRHGHVPAVRDLLLGRDDLPIGARFALVEGLCRVFAASDLVASVLGPARTSSVLDDAQGAALMEIAEGRDAAQLESLTDELAADGRIDAMLLLRALCHGQRELFAALLTRASGIAGGRVRSILRSRRGNALKGLLERCDLSPEVAAMLTASASLTLAAPAGTGPATLTTLVLERVRPSCAATGAMAVAVRRWQTDALRRGGERLARQRAA